MSVVKADMQALVNDLPDECTLEDVQYQLYVRQKIQNGLAAFEQKGGIAQADVEKQVAQWFE